MARKERHKVKHLEHEKIHVHGTTAGQRSFSRPSGEPKYHGISGRTADIINKRQLNALKRRAGHLFDED